MIRYLVRPRLLPCALALAGLLSSATFAAQTTTAAGFVVNETVQIAAPPSRVFDALTRQVGQWWNPEHTYSGNAANLSIDARPGGCFCERFPNGGGAEHMRVVLVMPNELLRLTGALGPLQASGLSATLTLRFDGGTSGTTLVMGYVVGGYMEGGFGPIAPAVRTVLVEQITRLKAFIETGRPARAAR